jgi:hypothetical protein
MPHQVNFPKIQEYLKKIVTLLNSHQIHLLNPDHMMACVMEDQNGNVSMAFMKAIKPQTHKKFNFFR